MTRQDYTYEALSGLTTSRRQRKEYVKQGIDLHKYRALTDAIKQLEAEIERIKAEHRA